MSGILQQHWNFRLEGGEQCWRWLWGCEHQKGKIRAVWKKSALPDLLVGSSVTDYRVSLCWGTAEITEHTFLPRSPESHWRATRWQTVRCPHLLLGLHSWSGHGNIGAPATGKQYTQMGKKCVIWHSCCFETFHYIACTAASSITAWRNNWPDEGNSAFIPESVHQGLDFCKCTYLPPSCKATDKEEPEMHLEMCVLGITSCSRICRDCHVL